jgi:flagellar hook protein FlgE
MNSTGFKTSELSFSNLVTQSLGAGLGTTQVGFGTATPLTTADFSQGAIQTSGGLLNGAISGSGFFVVTDPSSGNTEYTRAGNFQTDASGNLESATGDYVQGWTTQGATPGTIDTNGPVGNIVVPVGSLKAPVPTANITDSMNLNSSATPTTEAFSTPITIYDSLGTSHVLTLSFTNTGPGAWSYSANLAAADCADGLPDQVATGTLAFLPNGQMDFTNTANPITFTMPALTDGAASGGTITWNMQNANGTGMITQVDEASASSASSQDGAAAAQLTSVGLGDGGTILAQYSDGSQQMVGQVALASVRNPDTLIANGNNNYMLSELTATPNIGVPGTGGRGTISGGSLESSNVDIATEFTNLIVYQRSYEAAGKVVTTADQMSQDTINLISG